MPVNSRDAERAIRAKLARARDQLESLYLEGNAFGDRDPYKAGKHHEEDHGRTWVYALHLRPPIPIQWAVIWGEIVHNCRSALDQAVYALASEAHRKTPSGTGFPIYAKAAPFWEWGQPQIRHLGGWVQEYIRSVQPFAGDGIANRRLKSLHRYWTDDKHRAIAPWGFEWGTEGHQIINTDPPNIGVVFTDDEVFYEGDEVFRIMFATSPDQVHITGKLPLQLVIEDATEKKGDPAEDISLIIDTVAAIVQHHACVVGTPGRATLATPAPAGVPPRSGFTGPLPAGNLPWGRR